MTKQQEEELVDELVSDLLEPNKSIILHNDPVNTFDHVIRSLISYCKHSPVQAEQCTLIVHYNGKCSVKTGTENKLKPICTALLEAGLTAEIN
jgi:ATP-dependent Clp protease adaptor protein ClpS